MSHLKLNKTCLSLVLGTVNVARLSSLDRDLLKDTLAVVTRFKTLLRQRFHLDAM